MGQPFSSAFSPGAYATHRLSCGLGAGVRVRVANAGARRERRTHCRRARIGRRQWTRRRSRRCAHRHGDGRHSRARTRRDNWRRRPIPIRRNSKREVHHRRAAARLHRHGEADRRGRVTGRRQPDTRGRRAPHRAGQRHGDARRRSIRSRLRLQTSVLDRRPGASRGRHLARACGGAAARRSRRHVGPANRQADDPRIVRCARARSRRRQPSRRLLMER